MLYGTYANSVDSHQMPCEVASTLGLQSVSQCSFYRK